MSTRREPDQAAFLRDVSDHKMTVCLDQGLYRHLVFKQTKHAFNQWFEIVTYPHKLVLSGDMGTWVFSRIEDMFDFFRTDKGTINPQYWAEKLQNGTHGCSDAAKVYNGDAYKENLLASLDGYGLEEEKKAEVIEELNALDFDDEYWIMSQINDFEVDGFTFQAVWEISMKVYSYHYLWCCYAIVWGINQYDAHVEKQARP